MNYREHINFQPTVDNLVNIIELGLEDGQPVRAISEELVEYGYVKPEEPRRAWVYGKGQWDGSWICLGGDAHGNRPLVIRLPGERALLMNLGAEVEATLLGGRAVTECTCGADGLNATWDAVNRIINDKTSAERVKSWVGTKNVSVVTAQWKDSFQDVWSRIGSDNCIVGLGGSGDTISFYKIDELRVQVPVETSKAPDEKMLELLRVLVEFIDSEESRDIDEPLDRARALLKRIDGGAET